MPELTTHSDSIPRARIDGDTFIAALHGEIDLHGSPELRNELLGSIDAHKPRKVILNLSEVPYMDSSAIAVLVETLQRLRKSGGKVCLTNLQPRVKGLLEIARLDKLFTVTATEDDAKKI